MGRTIEQTPGCLIVKPGFVHDGFSFTAMYGNERIEAGRQRAAETDRRSGHPIPAEHR